MMDSIHVWHVAKTGSDGNGGHAQQYPIDLSADAKLTIPAAVTAASAGDKIIVWPGTYDSTSTASTWIDLSSKENITIEGMGWETIIEQEWKQSFCIIPGNGTVIKNIQLYNSDVPEQSGDSIAISGSNASNITVENCLIKASTGISGYYGSYTVRDCVFVCSEYGMNLGLGGSIYSNIVERCKIYCSGWTFCLSAPIWASSPIIVKDSNLYVDVTTPSLEGNPNYPIGGCFRSTAILQNCNIETSSDNDSYEIGIYTYTDGQIKLDNCVIKTNGDTACYDLKQSSTGSIMVSNCDYDTSKVSGTVTDKLNTITGTDGATLATAQANYAPCTLGAGAITFVYTLYTDETAETGPIGNVEVWVTTDEEGTNTIAAGTTNASGSATFYLDAATYYFWRQKSGYTFTNPDTEEVA